jgi:dUTPase
MKKKPLFKFALREDLAEDKRFLPTRATPLSSGWDVRAAQKNREPLIIRPGSHVRISLGVRAIPQSGWWLELKPRSSTFAKKYLNALIGTIDGSYRGELLMAVQYIPDISSLGKDLIVEFGEAIGQLIPIKLKEMEVAEISNRDYDEFCSTETIDKRGAGGFGSTGR